MIKNAFGLIYTGEDNMQLKDLTYNRSVAAVPFGGRYRCIDFMLSSLVNTGITNVGVITQRNYHSLIDHLESGKEWDLHRKRDGLFLLPPYVTQENTGVYKGTVDALKSSMSYIRRSAQRYCIFMGSHTLFNMTFDAAMAQHLDTGADITVLYTVESGPFSAEDQFEDVRFNINERGRVKDMEIDPYKPKYNNTSMDVYILEKSLLEYLVEDAVSRAQTDFVRDVLLKKLDSLKLFGFRYDGYVARITSPTSYFRHSMKLLDPDVQSAIFQSQNLIFTKIRDEAPARYGAKAAVKNSLIADGCVVDGEVENCILFRGVHVASGARVKNSILMQDDDIHENAQLENVILDKQVTVRRGRRLIGHSSFPVILRKNASV